MTRLEGVRAIVTGASRGVGRAVAEAYLAEGAHVLATARESSHLDGLAAAADAAGWGERLTPQVLDLADPASVDAAGAAARQALGACDVLVNNAGELGVRGPLLEAAPDLTRRVIEVNLTGTLRLTAAILPVMRRGSVIINVSSGAAGRADWGAYSVSKAGIEAATRMLREELADHDIRCVAVNPGGTRTAMRAAAYPLEDPATVPHPRVVVPLFVAIAEGLDPGWHVEAQQWTP
ncbi:MAG: SDR family oxidoreductase [Thermoleophilia bacterium]